MSDEDVNLTSFEDDSPAPEAATPAPAEPDTAPPVDPEAPPVDPDAPPKPAEVEAVEVGGQRYIPLAAHVAERKARQEAAEQAAKATQQLQALQAQYGDLAPYAQILRDNPDLLRPRQEPAREPATAPATPDPDLVQLAQTLDLYDPKTGQPDTEKASRIAGFLEKRAEQKAQQAIQPFQAQTIQARAHQNYAAALQAKLPDGSAVDKATFDALWQQAANEPNGLQTLSDPRSVMALVLMASGAQRWVSPAAPKVPAPAAPPLLTEPAGGHPRTRPTLSAIEERIARDRGVTPAKWSETTKGFTKGASNTLEE